MTGINETRDERLQVSWDFRNHHFGANDVVLEIWRAMILNLHQIEVIHHERGGVLLRESKPNWKLLPVVIGQW